MTGYETLIEALGGETSNHMYPCPSHDDKKASLKVDEGDDGRALMICFAGCPTIEVVQKLDLSMSSLFSTHSGDAVVQHYIYTDETGEPLIRVKRTFPKGFTQEGYHRFGWRVGLGDTRRVPYNLARLKDAQRVYIVEGEKDADRLQMELDEWGEGVVVTTLLGGNGKWRPEYEQYFQNKIVTIIADNDKPGIEGALKIRQALRGVATGLDVLYTEHGKDITDHLNAGHDLSTLTRYVTESDSMFEPVDWTTYEVPEYAWLFEPYVARASRVMVYGKAGSLKSLFAMWMASEFAKEGHKVAYFSLEMQAHETARRLNKMKPPTDNFKWYQRFNFTSQQHLDAAIELFKGHSLIVVDSWTAATHQLEMRDSNQAVARMDQEIFLPLIQETGAALMILDNTGHDVVTSNGKIPMDHARGASAKEDKMDTTLWLDRPDPNDNHKVRIRCNKMRLDAKIPKPVIVRTDPHLIDFKVVGDHDEDLGRLWDYFGEHDPYTDAVQATTSILERLKQAKARGVLDEQPA